MTERKDAAGIEADGAERAARAGYSKTTRGVEVRVAATFLESQSFPQLNHFFWAYRIEIENTRPEPIRLRRRHWRITDNLGRTEEVSGDGVVGEQPLIQPGATYTYTSGAPLATPSGLMSGRYDMEGASGDRFAVEIPTFSLDSPHEARTLN